MLKRVINFSLVSVVCLSSACSNGGDDGGSSSFGSFGTTQTTFSTTLMMEDEESGSGEGDGDGDPGDGDGDPTTTNGDGDGDPTTGDGDGDPTTGDGDGDTDCPLGQFGCPCDNGQCEPGLSCGIDNTCELGGGDGDGDAWDPNACVMPSVVAAVQDIAGEFCSAPCVVDGDCPAAPVGTDPACLLLLNPDDVDPTGCVLICDPLADSCPVGSSCKDVPGQPGIGICTYP